MGTNVPSTGGVDLLWAKKRKIKKENRKKRPEEKPGLLINSLMDAFVIILCFLLQSFGADPVQIRESEDMELTRSTSDEELVDAVVIGISKRSIQVDDIKVVDLRNGRVDETYLRDGAGSLHINPLYEKLKEKVQFLQQLAARNPKQPFSGTALVVADKNTDFRVISEVLYTAGQAEFEKFKFVAAEGSGRRE